jgi:phosphopantothenoylcysteine decarboxylase/phosphopantothenate--cysteine ligase
VLLLVSGGIAAYKACHLTRLLRQAGLAVKVAMTDAAQHFVTPMTFQVLSENPVATDLWGEGQSHALDHIEYARWADVAVIAPATANLLAKLTHGIADDIVSTLLLAHPGPVIAAPAMNDNMWAHPATQANLATLRSRGVDLVEPGEGFLACGVQSKGRLADPEVIARQVEQVLAGLPATAGTSGPAATDDAAPPAHPEAADPDAAAAFWRGQRVLVTAGPTREPVDAIRYLSNRSTGAMGAALARQLAALGARVTLIQGPGSAPAPTGLDALQPVTTAAEMAAAVADGLTAGCDWLFMAAAVADFTPARPASGKLKKDERGAGWALDLVRTPDILREVVAPARGDCRVVGFALETEDLEARARAKLAAKSLDWIVANDPTAGGGSFGAAPHAVILLGPAGEVWRNPAPLDKDDLAAALLARLAAEAGA